jgi:hypothetical protein
MATGAVARVDVHSLRCADWYHPCFGGSGCAGYRVSDFVIRDSNSDTATDVFLLERRVGTVHPGSGPLGWRLGTNRSSSRVGPATAASTWPDSNDPRFRASDCYQGKHYATPLALSDVIPEMLKVFTQAALGHSVLPDRCRPERAGRRPCCGGPGDLL